MGMDTLNWVENKKSLWTEVHDNVSWHWIPEWSSLFMSFHSASLREPNKTETYSFVPLKAEPHVQEEEGSKKRKRLDWLHSCVHSACCGILEVSCIGHHSQMGLVGSGSWQPSVCVCVVGVRGQGSWTHTHTLGHFICALCESSSTQSLFLLVVAACLSVYLSIVDRY